MLFIDSGLIVNDRQALQLLSMDSRPYCVEVTGLLIKHPNFDINSKDSLVILFNSHTLTNHAIKLLVLQHPRLNMSSRVYDNHTVFDAICHRSIFDNKRLIKLALIRELEQSNEQITVKPEYDPYVATLLSNYEKGPVIQQWQHDVNHPSIQN